MLVPCVTQTYLSISGWFGLNYSRPNASISSHLVYRLFSCKARRRYCAIAIIRPHVAKISFFRKTCLCSLAIFLDVVFACRAPVCFTPYETSTNFNILHLFVHMFIAVLFILVYVTELIVFFSLFQVSWNSK